MPVSDFMPKPRLALNVGIIGHRPNKLDDVDMVALASTVRSVCVAIDAAAVTILGESSNFYAPQSPLIRIVSALAEGADQIAVTGAPASWSCEAILPMPRDEYACDFVTDETRVEFRRLLDASVSVTELPLLSPGAERTGKGRAAQYQALGQFFVRQVDLLIAVWDGRAAEGDGGTADVIAAAIEDGRPVIWIDPRDAGVPRWLDALDKSFVRHSARPFDLGLVADALRPLLAPPLAPAHDHGHGGNKADPPHAALKMMQEPAWYRAAWPTQLRWAFAYTLLRRLCGAGRWVWPVSYPSYRDQLASWSPFFTAVGEGSASRAVRDVLLSRSVWADALAWSYGQLYRSAYISIFILASLSVPIGLCYLFFLDNPAILDIKAGFVVIELIIISAVLFVVKRGVRDGWHGQWLETRELSELLRLARHLAYVGALRSFVPSPSPGTTETLPAWYARATAREIGLPDAVLNAGYLRRVLDAMRTTEIAEQRAYHAANAHNLERIHHTLHHKGDACFAATIAILLIYLAAWGIDRFALTAAAHAAEQTAEHASHGVQHGLFHEFLEYILKPIVSIAAAGLPAIGAALAGIRAQGDFEGFAARSRATEQELGDIAQQIDALLARPGADDLPHVTDALMAATQVMARDVSAWRQTYVSKRLSLPA